jgi:uncharacterized membrane protein YphA (DoxX/SURF4 family)
MMAFARRLYGLLNETRRMDFLAPLLLRLYLAPVFWMAGTKKFASFIMLLALFFIGAGRYLSLDYWIVRRLEGHLSPGKRYASGLQAAEP